MSASVDYWWEFEDRSRVVEDYEKCLKKIKWSKPAASPPKLIVAGDFAFFTGSALWKAIHQFRRFEVTPLSQVSDEELIAPTSVIIKWAPQSEYQISAAERARFPTGKHVINDTHFHCAKENVQNVFASVADYSSLIDPHNHIGRAVARSNRNGAHDGRIVRFPQLGLDEDIAYDQLLDNSIGRNLVYDIRLSVLLGRATHAYVKFRQRHQRFANVNTRAFVCAPPDLLSTDEISLCLRFCECIGLEYGEVDVLRDRATQKIYIVDANNTPAGPPKALSSNDKISALQTISAAFCKLAFKGMI